MGQDATALGVLYDETSYDTALVWASQARYTPLHESELYADNHMWARADTAELSVNTAAALTMFRGLGPAGGIRDEHSFKGQFCQLTNAAPGTDWVASLDQFGFKNKAQSVLLTRVPTTPLDVRLSFRDTVLPIWNNAFGANAPGEVQQDGDPIFSWDPFPVWNQTLNPNRIYLTIHQKLIIDPPVWPSDYAATVTYWIRIFRGSNGVLTGGVRMVWVWVEGGTIHDVVLAILEPNANLAAITLGNQLRTALAALPPVSVIYLLPGRQLSAVQAGSWNVFVWGGVDDVTIVLQP